MKDSNKETSINFLKKNRHSLISYGLPTLISAFLYLFFVQSSLENINDNKYFSENLEIKISKAKVVIAKRKFYEKEIVKSKDQIKKYNKYLHDISAPEKMVQTVLNFAKKCRVEISGLAAGKTFKGEFYNEISLKVKVDGGFRRLIKFIRKLETDTKPYKIENLNIQKDGNDLLHTSFIIKALVKHGKKQ